jgi:cell division protein FtsN
MWNVELKERFNKICAVAVILSAIFATNLFAQTPTLADAQKAYVKGDWQAAASAYEAACPGEPDSLKAECYLWDVLALSQTGNSKLFKVAGHRLDSLIQTTPAEKTVYAELLLTKSQFMLYMGKNERAAEILIQAIDNSKQEQATVLQKVCTAVLARAPHQNLAEKCKAVKDSSLYKTTPAKTEQATPAPATTPAPETKPVAVAPAKPAAAPAPKNAPAKPVAPAPVVGAPYWTLQLGAFGVEANAKLLAENLKKQGLEGRIEARIGETRTLFLVQTGRFNSKEEAVDFGAKKLAPLNIEFQPVQKK